MNISVRLIINKYGHGAHLPRREKNWIGPRAEVLMSTHLTSAAPSTEPSLKLLDCVCVSVITRGRHDEREIDTIKQPVLFLYWNDSLDPQDTHCIFQRHRPPPLYHLLTAATDASTVNIVFYHCCVGAASSLHLQNPRDTAYHISSYPITPSYPLLVRFSKTQLSHTGKHRCHLRLNVHSHVCTYILTRYMSVMILR